MTDHLPVGFTKLVNEHGEHWLVIKGGCDMDEGLPEGFTTRDIMERQLRRELVRCFIVGLLQFGGGVLLIMALTWAWLAAHQ